MSMKKHSILKQIIVVFFTAIILASIVAGIISFVYSTRLTSQRSSQYARVGALDAAHIIESVDFEALCASDTSELYIKTRSMLRDICRSLNLKYLYLYQVSPEEQEIQFVMTVATEDKEDANVAEKRGLGVTVPRVLTDQEQAALQGEQYPQAYIEDNDFGRVYSWFYPVYDEEERVIALVGSDYSTEQLFRQAVKGTLLLILPMIAVLLLVFLAALFAMQRKIFAPIKLLSDRMNSFVSDSGTNLLPLNIQSGDEIQEIADSFEKMSQDINDYLQRIEKLTVERVQANVELEVASRIQCGIVPSETILKEERYNIYACAKPAKEVGGDFYDCFVREDGSVCALIGDVSGKGVAAAMFMVMAKTMFRDCLTGGASPAEALNRINDAICQSNPEGMFATVFVAVLEPDSGLLHYANAGHTRPVLLAGGKEFLEVDPGIAIGLFEDAGITDNSILLEGDQGILIYTDGVTEAVNNQKKFFGEERLLTAVETASDAEQTVKILTERVTDFVDETPQFDDYTVLALYYSGHFYFHGELRLKPELSSLSQLRDAVLNASGNDPNAKKIYLACEEAFANIVNYSKATAIEVLIKKEDNSLTVKFTDDGIAFHPFSQEREEKEFEELDTGGMGISLIWQLTKTTDYNRIDDKNFLSLGFELAASGEEQDP